MTHFQRRSWEERIARPGASGSIVAMLAALFGPACPDPGGTGPPAARTPAPAPISAPPSASMASCALLPLTEDEVLDLADGFARREGTPLRSGETNETKVKIYGCTYLVGVTFNPRVIGGNVLYVITHDRQVTVSRGR